MMTQTGFCSHHFQFFTKRFPICFVLRDNDQAFAFEGCFQGFRILTDGVSQQRTELLMECGCLRGTPCDLHQYLRGTALSQPECQAFRSGIMMLFKPMCLDQSLQHRPVLETLCFFRLNQIRKCHQIDVDFFQRQCRPPLPKLWKRIDSTHASHDIDSHPLSSAGLATEMNRMSSQQISLFKGRHSDDFRFKLLKRAS